MVFDLAAASYKTEENKREYGVRLLHVGDVRAIYPVFYPGTSGTLVVNDLKLAK